jgi:hypothetical protein
MQYEFIVSANWVYDVGTTSGCGGSKWGRYVCATKERAIELFRKEYPGLCFQVRVVQPALDLDETIQLKE